jgi:cell filamentation protein
MPGGAPEVKRNKNARLLDFSEIRGAEKQRYVAAIHAALGRNYEPMKVVFRRVIARSLKTYAQTAGLS